MNPKNTFIVQLKKHGNSFVLRVPPQIAKAYKLDSDIYVTMEYEFDWYQKYKQSEG